jgi:hypothetical protein
VASLKRNSSAPSVAAFRFESSRPSRSPTRLAPSGNGGFVRVTPSAAATSWSSPNRDWATRSLEHRTRRPYYAGLRSPLRPFFARLPFLRAILSPPKDEPHAKFDLGRLAFCPLLSLPHVLGIARRSVLGSGEVAGYYQDSSGTLHGFLYNNGAYTTVDDPSAGPYGTVAGAINASGQVAGYYLDSSSGTYHSFVYNNGAYTTLDDPSGPGGTNAQAINTSSEVAGYYVDSSGLAHAFVASATLTQLDHWINGRGGNWTTATSWSNGVPTSTIDADVDASGTYTVTVSSSDNAHALIINNAGTTVTDNKGGMLTLGGGSGALTISKGTFQLNGGALKAGSISTAPGGGLLIANSQNYIGANSLGEPITDNGAVTIQNSSTASITGNISGSGALTIQNSSTGNLTGDISGSETILVQNSSTATFGNLTGSETLTVQNSG